VTLATASGTITPASLTLTASSDSRVITGRRRLPDADGRTLYSTDSVTGLTQTFGSKNVLGSGSSTLSVSGYTSPTGIAEADYTVTLATASGLITLRL